MLSPLDLQNKRVMTKKKKYDKPEVDDYIDLLLENYKEAFNEVQELQKKVKTLSDGIQYYRSIESTMQKALVLAEKTSKETKDAALLKAEAIEKDANTKASKIISNAQQEYEKIKDKCVTLMQQFNQYKMQLKQVATAQLELVTSESFDVYSPELEVLHSSRNSLPSSQETMRTADDWTEEKKAYAPTNEWAEEKKVYAPTNEWAEEKRTFTSTATGTEELLPDEGIIEPAADNTASSKEDLDKTLILPDLRDEMLKQEKNKYASGKSKDEMSVLTADTIDLRSSLEQLQKEIGPQELEDDLQPDQNISKPVQAKTTQAKDAFVLEPTDATPSTPSDIKPKKAKVKQPELEVLEPIPEDKKDAPTLDSLLQSMNIGGRNKKKKKKGQAEEDPFEFLGSVDDF